MDHAAEAHRRVETEQRVGAIVIEIADAGAGASGLESASRSKPN
jgi:hypothetical protein